MQLGSVFMSSDIKNGVYGFGKVEIYDNLDELLNNHDFIVLPPLLPDKKIAYSPVSVFPMNVNVINVPNNMNKRIICFGYSVVYRDSLLGPKQMINPFDYSLED